MDKFPFDGLATFIILLIGLPALVVQNLPTELRRVLTTRKRRIARLLIQTGGFLLLLGIFAVSAVYMQMDASFPVPHDLIWATLLLIATMLTGAASFAVLYWYGRRTTMVAGLGMEIKQRLAKTGQLESKPLQDLIELGQQSQGGQDKDVVLQQLYQLTVKTCEHSKYRGDSLERLIQGLVDIVASDPFVGSSKNFETAADILQQIVMSEPLHDPNSTRRVDVLYAADVASALGQSAIRYLKSHLTVEEIALSYIQVLSLVVERHRGSITEASEALRDIGIVAVENDKMLIAMTALEKLCTLVQDQDPANGELTADTLGLIAHFWKYGPAAREYAEQRLDRIRAAFAVTFASTLKLAREHCLKTSRFKTADYLDQIIEELEI